MNNKIFDPKPLFQDLRTDKEKKELRSGDRRDGKVYGYTSDLVLAINVALATGRPLLLRGHAGCGKSSVAYNIARYLERCYYELVVSSRMEARDLLWRFDAVRRLGDAQVAAAAGTSGEEGAAGKRDQKDDTRWRSYYPYIEPGVLWWLFDAISAARRGLPPTRQLFFNEAKPPVIYRPAEATPLGKAVLLLDEIDKAEPDVPNNLLVAMGSMQFEVEEIGTPIKFEGPEDGFVKPEELPLIVITTNEERQLPPAFLRRCVVYRFPPTPDDRLIEIATMSEGPEEQDEKGLYDTLATTMRRLAEEEAGPGAQVSIAEYLDSVRACKRLGATRNKEHIVSIVERTTWKQPSRD